MLIERASAIEEEDVIKDLILNVVRDAWFSSELQGEVQKGGELTDQRASKKARIEAQESFNLPNLDSTTRQIVDVVAATRDTDWAANVIDAALRGAGSPIKSESVLPSKISREQQRHRSAAERAESHVSALFEHLLRLDELRQKIFQMHENDHGEAQSEGDGEAAADIVATVTTLRTFARARPILIAPRLLLLAPYLRGDNKLCESHEGAVCCVVAETMAACVDVLPRPEAASVVATVVPDLATVLHRFGTAPVAAAVRCLAVMARSRCGEPAKSARDQLARLACWYFDALKRAPQRHKT